MCRLIAMLTLLIAVPTAAKSYCVGTYPQWAYDFTAFMKLMDCASVELADTQDRPVYLEKLSNSLVGVAARWVGTVRQVRGDRLYFNESFVKVGPGTRAARVMYYAATDDSEDWERISAGQQIAYTGKVLAVKVDALRATKPMLFIELHAVGRVKEGNANNGIELTR